MRGREKPRGGVRLAVGFVLAGRASLSYRAVVTPLVRPIISEPARGRLWRGRPRARVMAGLLSGGGASLPRQHRAGAVRRWSPGTYSDPVD